MGNGTYEAAVPHTPNGGNTKICSVCKLPKDREQDFYIANKKTGRRLSYCKVCHLAAHTARADQRKQAGACRMCDRFASPGKMFCEHHLAKHRAQARQRRDRQREAGVCVACGCQRPPMPGVTLCELHRYSSRKSYQILRDAIIANYGNKCSNCGEADRNVLQLDHVNNDGAAHRRQLGDKAKVWRWARKNGYPSTLQLLCANCHAAKTITGDCGYRRDRS